MSGNRYPYLAWAPAAPSDEPGYRLGVALEDLAEWAIEQGLSLEEWLERADEAFERAGEL